MLSICHLLERDYALISFSRRQFCCGIRILCKHMVNSLAGPGAGLQGELCLQKAGSGILLCDTARLGAKQQPRRAESLPLWGFVFSKLAWKVPKGANPALLQRWTTTASCSSSCGDAIFFASRRGDSFGRPQRALKPNCKQRRIDEFSSNTAGHLFLFYSVAERGKYTATASKIVFTINFWFSERYAANISAWSEIVCMNQTLTNYRKLMLFKWTNFSVLPKPGFWCGFETQWWLSIMFPAGCSAKEETRLRCICLSS